MAKRNIESWLTDLDLADHAWVFADNRIDFDVLGDLGEDNLRELGLALGDRKRLVKAIENLSADNPPAVPEHRPAGHRGGASAINLSLSTSRAGAVKR